MKAEREHEEDNYFASPYENDTDEHENAEDACCEVEPSKVGRYVLHN
jgi:hypothetical protein